MTEKTLGSHARCPIDYFHFALVLIMWFASWSVAAQDRDQDRDRAAAREAVAEGDRLRKENTGSSRLQAIDKYQEALALQRATGDRSAEVETITLIGLSYNALGDYRKAVQYWDQALPLYHALGKQGKEGSLLISAGAAYNKLNEKERALDYLGKAAQLLRAEGERQKEAQALGVIGNIYNSIGDKWKALEYWRQALPIRRELKDKQGEAGALVTIGSYYNDLGEKQKAIDHLLQGLSLVRDHGDKSSLASALYQLGLTYDSINERQNAVACFKEGLELRKAEGAHPDEGVNLWSIGNFYDGLGEKQAAIDHYILALPILQAAKNPGVANVLRNLGLTYESLGDRQMALEYFKRAAPLVLLGGNRKLNGRLLANIGKLLCETGEYEQALEHLNKALRIMDEFSDAFFEIHALHWSARAERGRGNLQAAANRIAEAINKIENLRSTVNIPELRSSAFTKAQEIYEFAIDTLMQLHRRRPAENYAAMALLAREQARAREMLGMLAEARADIRQGVEPALLARERALRERLDAQANSLTFLLSGKRDEAKVEVARRELDNLQTEYQQTQAQIRRVSPRYAALTLPQPLSLAEIQRQVLDADTLLLEYALGEERSYLWVVTADSLKSYELPCRSEIEQASRRVYELLKARNEQVMFEAPDERKARIAQADAEYPQAAAALAGMVLGPVADQLTRKRLLIVSDGALQYVPFAALPVPETGRQRDREIGGQRDRGTEGQNDRETKRPNFSASLRPSVSPSLRLSGAPSPRLSVSSSPRPSVAFRPLIVDYEIVTLPSASTLGVLRRELEGRAPAPKSVAVLADPVFDRGDERMKTSFETRGAEKESDLARSVKDINGDGQGFHLSRLPFTRKEAEAILSLAPASERFAALDFTASQFTVFKPELAQYRYVHFATHGLLNSLRPELSGIVLSLVNERGADQDGFLRAHEVFDLRLPAEMVVLSGCRTGLGKDIRGEGLVGLTRGFMYAGAARVMVSLWDVNDQATSQLMARLYQGILGKRRLSPAAALREAQISFWRDRRWQAPYYWAAFTLQGEPR